MNMVGIIISMLCIFVNLYIIISSSIRLRRVKRSRKSMEAYSTYLTKINNLDFTKLSSVEYKKVNDAYDIMYSIQQHKYYNDPYKCYMAYDDTHNKLAQHLIDIIPDARKNFRSETIDDILK